MDQVKGALTRKIGPFPGWAWAGIAAVGVWLIAPHLGGLLGSSTAGAAAGTVTDTTGTSAGPAGPAGPPGDPGAPGGSAGAPAPPVPAPAAPPPAAHSRTHVVVSGDTLWGIAQTFLGNGARYPEIYAANAAVIESTAIAHGFAGSDAGHWIFPGTVLVIPGAVGGAAKSIGNRRSTLMSAHHPDLKLPVRYPQTLRAVGGPAAHAANVHKVAHAAGVHPARLLALNSHYRGIVRIA